MKKIITMVAIVMMMISFTSAIDSKPEVARAGYQAPNFKLHNIEGKVAMELQRLRGQEVIITFWSSANPASRIANRQAIAEAKQKKVRHISVNLDRESVICHEICQADGISAYYCTESDRDNLKRDWGIDDSTMNGMGTWHVNADGKITSCTVAY